MLCPLSMAKPSTQPSNMRRFVSSRNALNEEEKGDNTPLPHPTHTPSTPSYQPTFENGGWETPANTDTTQVDQDPKTPWPLNAAERLQVNMIYSVFQNHPCTLYCQDWETTSASTGIGTRNKGPLLTET